jgi:hypothetical protein
MPPPYTQPHYNTFTGIPFQQQMALGKAPSQWVADLGLQNVPDVANLPNQPLDRAGLRAICLDPKSPVLFGYVCTMCWGSQEKGPRGARGVTDAWQSQDKIEDHLEALRAGNLNRSEAYSLFRKKKGKVKGLGPSYFTKLLFFFSPDYNFWIMDQWTGKSINLLTGKNVVRFSGSSPSDQNKGGNYQAYCEEVDALAKLLNTDGNEIEQRLMSKGKPKPWPWRSHVVANCGYNKATMTLDYPHINPREL